MANIFTLENVADFSEKLNIDELYERKRVYDLNQLGLYNKLLNRIHVRIKITAKQKMDEQFCWFVVPEIMIGVPKYDQTSCIAYLIDKLKENKFNVRYIHPNTLMISWNHWVPTYVRNEIKSKTGVILDEFGREKDSQEEGQQQQQQQQQQHPLAHSLSIDGLANKKTIQKQPAKSFTPIQKYKPQGNLVYADELLEQVDFKIN